ncbi:PPC domain-containing protein [Solwaraspora sp. WMMD1047]|uniref:PPC domain-containing protein n=1 Tax=Solwaraspora sp. WMMD1047 TaxID=3016102 RepID=UPI0024171348|nr:PPC domain-containing protein [Solwaraspora sp. WMMD1047]MDG4832002.1 PPC domain-containing protein [Solwaraspora sp. WMMD1047]
MRRTTALLAVSILVGGLLTPATAQARPAGEPDHAASATLEAARLAAAKPGGTAGKPAGANPYLALLPDPSKADYAGWRAWMSAQGELRAQQKAKQRALAPTPLLVDEAEPAGIRGSNESPANAQRITGFGTGPAQNQRMRVLGTLSPEDVAIESLPPGEEDNGAIPLATETGIDENLGGITTTGEIGDGPHGSGGTGNGDFDFYSLSAAAGDVVTVDIDTPDGGSLDSVVALYDEAGEIVALNDDSVDGLDSLLTYEVTVAGTYFVLVTGFPVLPNDPFDSGSGTGADSEGPYAVSISKLATDQMDVDFYAVQLRKGDVLGASVAGAAAEVTIWDTPGQETHGSTQDASGIYPASTPLPGGGNAVADHVVDRTGWHYVGVASGDGDYDLTVEVFRPVLEGQRPVQKLFLDFDGARVNTAIFGGPGVRDLSPFRAFLGQWGLTAADENAVIDAIIAEVRENLRRDMLQSGLNPDFDIRLLNSRDHADPFGQPNVSRVVIGGTIEESGVPTIGIAQSIDPGNFETEESALVLLDVMSGPSDDELSLNYYLNEASDRVAFVGQAIGNVTSHEAGHFFGNWHVDQFNDTPNLMDQGGNFPVMYGVGPDGIGGTADDTDVDFGEDHLNPGEGFTGIEDTHSRIALTVTK